MTIQVPAVEPRGNNLEGFSDFYLENDEARFWTWFEFLLKSLDSGSQTSVPRIFWGKILLPESQDQNLALTVLIVPCSLGSSQTSPVRWIEFCVALPRKVSTGDFRTRRLVSAVPNECAVPHG